MSVVHCRPHRYMGCHPPHLPTRLADEGQGDFTLLLGRTTLCGSGWIYADTRAIGQCWDDRTKTLIIERLRVNELGVQDRRFKWEQMWEVSEATSRIPTHHHCSTASSLSGARNAADGCL
jgi:hypothetical protein